MATRSRLRYAVPVVLWACFAGSAWAGAPSAAKALASEIFADGFEPYSGPPPVPVVTGTSRFTTNPFMSPSALGSQIESLSNLLLSATESRFLQADTSALSRNRPEQTIYVHFEHFDRMHHAAGGEIEAPLTPVDLSLDAPAASTSGCEPSDFAGFPPGHIALVQRGGCSFSTKALHADAAGAVGLFVFNQGTSDRLGRFFGTLSDGANTYNGPMPVISTTFALGQDWAQTPGAIFRLKLDAGMMSNVWELKPIATSVAGVGRFWIRNRQTGQHLYAGSTIDFNGNQVSRVELGSITRQNSRGWWLLTRLGAQDGALRLFNVGALEYLTTVVRGADDVALLTVNDGLIDGNVCPNDSGCDQWRLDNEMHFQKPPSGTTRIRSGLGNSYLHLSGTRVRSDRIKPGWPSAQWILEPASDNSRRRIRNAATGAYLYTESGSLKSGDVSPFLFSAQWLVEEVATLTETNDPVQFFPVSISPTIAVGYVTLRASSGTQQLVLGFAGPQLVNLPIGAPPMDGLDALWVLDDFEINISDPNLRSAVETVLGKESGDPILSSEAAGVYALSLANRSIANLDGIQHFINLTDLDLSNNAITNVTPLAALKKLNLLDLSRNPLSSIDPLLESDVLGDGDRLVWLRNNMGLLPPDTGEVLLSRGVTIIPSPGMMPLHHTLTNKVMDTQSGGRAELIEPELATNGANWMIEYNVGQDRFWIRNSYLGYMTWEDQNNSLEFTGTGRSDPEWRFEQVLTGIYRIRNTRLAGEQPYLLICNGNDLDINAEGCTTGTWFIDPNIISEAVARAVANYYDPKFAKPPKGFTRIQNTKSREFLHMPWGALEIGRPDESSLHAQWEPIPVRFDNGYYFALRNRALPAQYLYRDADEILRAGPLPAGPPDGPEWATHPAQMPYLFDLDGEESFFIKPLPALDRALRSDAGGLTFSGGIGTATVWRLDGGVAVPEPSQPDGFIELRTDQPPLYDTDFSVSYRVPSGPRGQYVTVSWSDAEIREANGIVDMPANAIDIRAKAVCNGCAIIGNVTIFDRSYDRPPNSCIEVKGEFFDPHYGSCDESQGSLFVFAAHAAEQASCEIRQLVDFIPSIFEEVAVDGITKDLIAGDFESAQQGLFGQGNLQLPNFTDCSPYRSMSFGAGAAAGVFSFEAGGELGVNWDLTTGAGSGAFSYTATGASLSPEPRLLSLAATSNIGVWKAAAANLGGASIGVSLGANRAIPVDLNSLKKLKKIGISGGISLWFSCGSGTGETVLNSEFCVLREDSTYQGFSFDFSAGVDISLPLPGAVSATYSVTCVPANFEGSPRDCL